jgi:hypothetical protein
MQHQIHATPKGQTGMESLLEALTGTATGFVLSLIVQQALFPVLGHAFSYRDNLVISSAFTVLSVMRSLVVQRLFNWFGCKPIADVKII